MRRRDFVKAGALAGAGVALSGRALAGAPDYMPIMKEKMESGDYVPHYHEPELTGPVLLCNEDGELNPDAVGWARHPYIRANLSGHWPRKKKWNFWNWISPDFVFSVTLADIDYLAFCTVSFIDFKSGGSFSKMVPKPGGSPDMPEQVEKSVYFKGRDVEYSFDHRGDFIKVNVRAKAGGKKVRADFKIIKPEGHETLNIVVTWSKERFQMNSKHNTLPCEGVVTVGEDEYIMDPSECYGVQDFGRGMWPYRSCWNWGVAQGKHDGETIGVNVGAKWTTGTGINENAICRDGRLYKIMEDLVWEYDARNWTGQWHVYTSCSDMLDLVLEPFHESSTDTNLGLLKTGGTCVYGLWRGALNFPDKTVRIKDFPGWAEEFTHRW